MQKEEKLSSGMGCKFTLNCKMVNQAFSERAREVAIQQLEAGGGM